MADYLLDAHNGIKTYFENHYIPTYFYQCFFGELVKVWGVQFLIPDTDDWTNNEDEYSYKNQLEEYLANIGGTAGWYEAFKEACKQCDLVDILDDYSKMNWVYSDIFDGYIADKMLSVLFNDTHRNDYYGFIMGKEK